MVEVTEKFAMTDKSQEPWDFSESESRDRETCCIQKFRNFREFSSWKQKIATSFSYVVRGPGRAQTDQYGRDFGLVHGVVQTLQACVDFIPQQRGSAGKKK